MLTQDDLNLLKSALASKEDIAKLATKEEIENLATREELSPLATKEDLEKLASKEDLSLIGSQLEKLQKQVTLLESQIRELNHKTDVILEYATGIEEVTNDHEKRLTKIEHLPIIASDLN